MDIWVRVVMAICMGAVLSAQAQQPSVHTVPIPVGPGDGFPLEPMIDAKGAIWKMSPDDFMKANGNLGFTLGSGSGADSSETARLYKQPVSFLSMDVAEVLVRFEANQPREITISLYNRGDMGDIDSTRLEDMAKVAQDRISEWTGTKSITVVDPAMKSMGVKKEGRVWTKEPSQYKLEWSYSSGSKGKDFGGIRPEYMKLRCQGYDATRDYRSVLKSVSASREKSISLSGLKANVNTEPGGDIYVKGVPMVDQGMKGYCVVATMERMMRYYGRDLDQHELAQMASSSASLGTDPRSMVEALRKIGVAFGSKIQVHEDFSVQEFIKGINKYNTLAKSRGKAEIKFGQVINIGEVYGAMDNDILRELKTRNKADVKNFMATIDKDVKQGIPLVWSVILGKIPEPDIPQAQGGHMRLIIGYNPKTSQILYSDSWGTGHELKRMAAEDAWLITMGLYSIEPRRTTL